MVAFYQFKFGVEGWVGIFCLCWLSGFASLFFLNLLVSLDLVWVFMFSDLSGLAVCRSYVPSVGMYAVYSRISSSRITRELGD